MVRLLGWNWAHSHRGIERLNEMKHADGRRDGMDLNLIFYKSFIVPFSSYPPRRRISAYRSECCWTSRRPLGGGLTGLKPFTCRIRSGFWGVAVCLSACLPGWISEMWMWRKHHKTSHTGWDLRGTKASSSSSSSARDNERTSSGGEMESKITFLLFRARKLHTRAWDCI